MQVNVGWGVGKGGDRDGDGGVNEGSHVYKPVDARPEETMTPHITDCSS